MRMVPLGDVAEINPRGGAPHPEAEISFVGMAELNAENATALPLETRRYSDVSRGYTVFRNGDILAAKITPCWENGKVGQAILTHPVGVGSTEFHVVRPGSELDERYLLYFLRQPWVNELGELRMTGSAGQRRVPMAFLRNIEIPLPPLPEQKRIAAILDKTDSIRTKRSQVLDQLDALTQSIFHEMFALSDSETIPIGEFAYVRSGSTPSRKNPANHGGTIPWVKTAEVAGNTIWETSETVTAEGVRNARLTKFPAGSVVIAMYGQGKTRGQSAILGVPATTNQACAVILPNESFDPAFLQTQLDISYERLRKEARGGNQPNLSVSRVQAFKVTLPPISTQQEFASVIHHIKRLRTTVRQALTTDNQLFSSLQSRAFKGEL